MQPPFNQMAQYNLWANRRLYDACAQLSPQDYLAARRSFFGSIHATLNHILAGDRVWLRVERQTLARLPDTDSILFTIRIHRWPLARLAALPEAVTRLRQAMETMPPDLQQYKSMPVFGAAVHQYLIRLEA